MGWTDERVELLKRLWGEGLSASQIANELGGVTRNAVIGKVHRLGLSGREKPAAAPAKPRKQQVAAPRPAARAAQPFRGNTALALAEAPILRPLPTLSPVPAPLVEVALPVCEPVTIMELREGMCRWPLGDPSSPEFRFCGGRTASLSVPYCTHHCGIAYQPVNDRRRDRKSGGQGARPIG